MATFELQENVSSKIFFNIKYRTLHSEITELSANSVEEAIGESDAGSDMGWTVGSVDGGAQYHGERIIYEDRNKIS